MGCMLVTHVSHVWVCTYTYACNNVGIAVVKKNKQNYFDVFITCTYLYMTVHFLEMFLLHTCLLYFFIKMLILATGYSFGSASRPVDSVTAPHSGVFIGFMFVARIQ